MKTISLIVAAGKGLRFGGEVPKQFRNLHQRPLLSWTVQQFEKAVSIDEIVIVVAEDFLLYTNEKIANVFNFSKLTKIVVGGETRAESVRRGLESLPISTGFVAIHDGARPVINSDDINRVIGAAQNERAAILARPIADTVKRVESGYIISTLDRSKLYQAETPQVFQYDLILGAHKNNNDMDITDDAFLIERAGFKIRTVIPEKPNPKITTEDDLKVAEFLLGEYYEA
jgi:2-C-methyl-D-erythritol 4-phosphate cytidylyltransferase